MATSSALRKSQRRRLCQTLCIDKGTARCWIAEQVSVWHWASPWSIAIVLLVLVPLLVLVALLPLVTPSWGAIPIGWHLMLALIAMLARATLLMALVM